MAENTRGYPWLKMYTNWPENPKLRKLTDAQKWRYIHLYMLAGRSDAGGLLMLNDEILDAEYLAYEFRQPIEVLECDLEALLKAGLIECEQGGYVVSSFMDEQGSSYADKREGWKERQQKRRKRLKAEQEEDQNKDQEQEEDKDLDLEKEQDIEKDKDKEVTRESRVTSENDSLSTSFLFSENQNLDELELFWLNQVSSTLGKMTEEQAIKVVKNLSAYPEQANSEALYHYQEKLVDGRLEGKKAETVIEKFINSVRNWDIQNSELTSISEFMEMMRNSSHDYFRYDFLIENQPVLQQAKPWL